jgi:chromosome partitioning protein
MKTIAFVNSKGGTGKSTLAAVVGVAAKASGEKVFMIDLDPQSALSAWGDRRKAGTPAVDRIARTGSRPPSQGSWIHPCHHRHTRPRHAGHGRCHAGGRPVPDTGQGLDTRSGGDPRDARRPRSPRPRIADASRVLSLLGVLAPVMVQRMEHVDAIGLGLGVTELDGKAADETNAL